MAGAFDPDIKCVDAKQAVSLFSWLEEDRSMVPKD